MVTQIAALSAADRRDVVGPSFASVRNLGFARRLLHTVAGLVYLFFFFKVYRDYVSIEWRYAGFDYRPLDLWELLFVVFSVAIVSFTMPQRIVRASAIITWLMYAFLYVPAMAITFILGEFPPREYVAPLSALTFSLILMSLVSHLKLECRDSLEALPGPPFIVTVLAVFFVFTVAQYVMYSDIISFSSIEDVYYQRFAASEIGGGPLGYARTHYYYVLSPALVALGLCSRRLRALLFLGIAGFIFTYMIDASKIALVIPLAMMALYWLAISTSLSASILTGGLTFLTFVCSLLTSQSALIRFLADLIILRSISAPAQTFHQYHDLFTQRGYTWWSNVSGIRLFVPPPSGFEHDSSWPTLGLIIGREYYGSVLMNANANPFSGEGVAAAGSVGVVVIGVLMAAWMRAFDLAARGWNRVFVLLVAAPLGLCLTNVHLSTLLLSFGGVFWLSVMTFYKPGKRFRSAPSM